MNSAATFTMNHPIEKKTLPTSLKIALGMLLLRIFLALTLALLQTWFIVCPPTSGALLQFWIGMQESLGSMAMNPAYLLGYEFGAFLLSIPTLFVICAPSRPALIVARVCTFLSLFINVAGMNGFAIVGDFLMLILLFSKGAGKYAAN